MKISIFLFLSFICLFSSCNKDNNTPQTPDPPQTEDPVITALKAHIWLFDSIETFHNGVVVDSLIEPGSPKIEMRYTDDMLYFSYPGGVQNDPYNYEVEDSNKLYRWREGNSKNEYFIIQQLTDKLFVLSTHDEEYLEYDYYSAKP